MKNPLFKMWQMNLRISLILDIVFEKSESDY